LRHADISSKALYARIGSAAAKISPKQQSPAQSLVIPESKRLPPLSLFSSQSLAHGIAADKARQWKMETEEMVLLTFGEP
jgi:hypothetical protein